MRAHDDRDVDAERIEANRMALGSPGSVVDVPVSDLESMLVGWPVAGHASVRHEDICADPDSLSGVVFDAEKQRRGVRAAGEEHPAAAPSDRVLDEDVVRAPLNPLVGARV